MKYLIALLMFTSASAFAQTNLRTVMANTNGVVQRPTNFFSINRILTFDTNGNVIYTNTNTLTFTNILGFNTNIVAAVRTNLQLGGGITTNITFVDAATNTNTVSISNGIITGWTR
jgi:hypothetical protein